MERDSLRTSKLSHQQSYRLHTTPKQNSLAPAHARLLFLTQSNTFHHLNQKKNYTKSILHYQVQIFTSSPSSSPFTVPHIPFHTLITPAPLQEKTPLTRFPIRRLRPHTMQTPLRPIPPRQRPPLIVALPPRYPLPRQIPKTHRALLRRTPPRNRRPDRIQTRLWRRIGPQNPPKRCRPRRALIRRCPRHGRVLRTLWRRLQRLLKRQSQAHARGLGGFPVDGRPKPNLRLKAEIGSNLLLLALLGFVFGAHFAGEICLRGFVRVHLGL